MKKYLLTLITCLANVISIFAQISEAKNALNHLDKHFFIENKGQWPDEVFYLTRIGSLDAWITKNGILYDFYNIEEAQDNAKTEEILPSKFKQNDYTRIGHKIWYKFQGNNSLISSEGKEKQTGYYNYLVGNDPSKHASNVCLYKEALIKNVYDGIDMRYYFDKGNIRYDYVVNPGADPTQINFVLEGTVNTYLNSEGDLLFNTRFGQVALAELLTYQGTKDNKVDSRFVKSKNGWRISLGTYNSRQTLIIDPLIYSTYLGGNSNEQGSSIVVNVSGNAYVTGTTSSTNYDTTSGAYQKSHGGGTDDVFVTKLNVTGTDLVYSTYLGGSDLDQGNSIAIDAFGNAYITGNTESTNYHTTSGAYKSKIYPGDLLNAFVTKLNTMGTALVYSTYLGGSNNDQGNSIVIDTSGNAYVTGTTNSRNYDTTLAAYQTSYSGGNSDVFITKLNAAGTALVYSTYLGGNNSDYGNSITIDRLGNAYVTGSTQSVNYDTTSGSYQTSHGGGTDDIFVTKLNSTGTALVYSTYLGGNKPDFGNSITIDSSGNAYITGSTQSTNYDTTSGAYQTSYGGGPADVFVTKLNGKGNALVYSTYLGGSGYDRGNAIIIDTSGNVYVSGTTGSNLDYDTTSGAYQTSLEGIWDAFVTRLNTTGAALVYSTLLGGESFEEGTSIAIDASGYAYVTGYSWSNNYDTTSGAYQTSFGGGGWDVFVSKICPSLQATISLSSSSYTDLQSVCMNNAITKITYATKDASSATVTGLPDGVKVSFVANEVTLSGTPTASGTFIYTVTLIGGCRAVIAKGRITVKPPNTVSLSSASGTDSQSVCINTPINNIRFASTGANGATVSGLPNGVTASYASNIVTISGTPTASGTYNYIVTLIGGCGTVTAKGKITVKLDNSIGLTSGAGTDSQIVCLNTAIANITYATTGATGAAFDSLPPGVIGSFTANTVTISGTPTANGTYHYIVTLTGGCGSVIAKGSLIVKPDNTISLSSATGTDSQSVCIHNAINNITYATTEATGATVTGLPAGVTGSFATNTITISGTPTASGTYHYTVTLTGGCWSVIAKGSLIVKPDNTISLSSNAVTNSQSVCINTAITDITYTTTDASGATFTDLPAGVNGNFATNTVTLSGTPTVSGTFNYSITLSGGCGTAIEKGSIIVKPDNTITLSSASGTDAQSVNVNSSITNITYATTGASGATVSGLPVGVVGSFAANEFTISGTPITNGIFNYSITLTGGCGTAKTNGSIHVGNLGIAHQTDKQNLQIFPNPSNVEVCIKGNFSTSVQIQIIDDLGRVSQPIYLQEENTIKLNVSSLENGIYCIRIIDSGQEFQSKIIVHH